jgi:hypothetical protein
VGSAYPLVESRGPGWVDIPDPIRLYGSGRQALRALLEFGRREYGWTVAHLPSYYCPEVVEDVARVIEVRRYDAGPDGAGADGAGPDGAGSAPVIGRSDVVIAMCYFGEPPVVPEPAHSPAALIVDASHDPCAPWLAGSRADYVFASLRKTLPLPDGGAVWSAGGRPLPPPLPTTDQQLATVGRFLSAMCLKAAYLNGAPVVKERYLDLYAAGDAALRSPGLSGISDYSRQSLATLPVVELRRRRIDNANGLAADLATLRGARARAHPFGVVLRCDSASRREAVRAALISRAVYPAVLWRIPTGAAPAHQLDLSRRMLFLHTDFRWSREDMRRVATVVAEACRHLTPPEPRGGGTRDGTSALASPEGAPC